MSHILITGGAGFIGSSLADQLLKEGHNVVIVDNMLTGRMDNLPKLNHQCQFHNIDANDFESMSELFAQNQFNFVFHYAAVVGVNRTLEKPLLVLDDIDGFKIILSLSQSQGVTRVFYASSSEVYGESETYPQDEINTPLNSRLPYAIVKNIGESYFRSYHQMYQLPFTLFRFFNTYGPKQSPDFVISKFLKAALNNEDITVYGDGSQSRTFCYIDDNINACVAALNSNSIVNDVVNIGNDVELSINEVAKQIIDVTGSSSKIVNVPALTEGDMQRRQPDLSKMKSILLDNQFTFRQGLEQILKEDKINRWVK